MLQGNRIGAPQGPEKMPDMREIANIIMPLMMMLSGLKAEDLAGLLGGQGGIPGQGAGVPQGGIPPELAGLLGGQGAPPQAGGLGLPQQGMGI